MCRLFAVILSLCLSYSGFVQLEKFFDSMVEVLFFLKTCIRILQLSPCDLLNSRDKFRQRPPVGLPHTKYGEVEGYFGVLITLYHIRKLLSSHGIRPAYEMLEEKMKQGYTSVILISSAVVLKKIVFHITNPFFGVLNWMANY